MVTAGIIDLDTVPPGDTGAGGPRPRVAVPRPVRGLLLLALLLATMGGSVVPPPGIVRVLSAGGTAAAAFALGPDTLYLAQFGENPDSGSVLRAYRLPGGAPAWSGSLNQNVQNLVIDPASRVLMARSGTDPRTAFLDADTGDTLWRTAEPNSTVVTLVRGRALIRTDLSTTETSLRMVDARTGRRLWTRTVDPAAELGPDELYGDAPSRIVAVGATGEVTVLDWAGGAVLSQGDLHVKVTGRLVDPTLPADDVAVSTVGDRLYVSRRTAGRTSTTAYSTVPLVPVWTATGGPVGQVTDCGVVLCVTDTRWVSGIDPASGAVRWADPAWSAAGRWDSTRLFAYDQQEIPEAALLDAATGTVTRRLGRASYHGPLMLTADGRVPGRALVSDTGSGRVAGTVDGVVAYGCTARDHYLACPTDAGPTTVWKVP